MPYIMRECPRNHNVRYQFGNARRAFGRYKRNMPVNPVYYALRLPLEYADEFVVCKYKATMCATEESVIVRGMGTLDPNAPLFLQYVLKSTRSSYMGIANKVMLLANTNSLTCEALKEMGFDPTEMWG